MLRLPGPLTRQELSAYSPNAKLADGNSTGFFVRATGRPERGGGWRRRWDSNPRWSCPHAGFQDRYIRPLCHSSAGSPASSRFLSCRKARVPAQFTRLHPNHAKALRRPATAEDGLRLEEWAASGQRLRPVRAASFRNRTGVQHQQEWRDLFQTNLFAKAPTKSPVSRMPGPSGIRGTCGPGSYGAPDPCIGFRIAWRSQSISVFSRDIPLFPSLNTVLEHARPFPSAIPANRRRRLTNADALLRPTSNQAG